MARKFKFCAHCRRTITEQEIARGSFVQTKDGMLCATCAQRLDEEETSGGGSTETGTAVPTAPESLQAAPAAVPPSAPPDPSATPQAAGREKMPGGDPDPAPAEPEETHPEDPAELLESIHRHLAAIHRTLVFEKSSPWTVVATVAQCLALGMLMIAVFNWADKPDNLLLVALIFQVMALAFFVRGK